MGRVRLAVGEWDPLVSGGLGGLGGGAVLTAFPKARPQAAGAAREGRPQMESFASLSMSLTLQPGGLETSGLLALRGGVGEEQGRISPMPKAHLGAN